MSREFVEFEGLKELEAALRNIAPQIKGNPLRTAARAMTVPFQERAGELAPKDPSTKTDIALAMDKKLIPVSERDVLTAKGDSAEIYEVGPRRKKKAGVLPAWYAHFLEFGTDRQSAQPFMRPAFEQTKDEAMKAFEAKLRKTLMAAAKRLAKK